MKCHILSHVILVCNACSSAHLSKMFKSKDFSVHCWYCTLINFYPCLSCGSFHPDCSIMYVSHFNNDYIVENLLRTHPIVANLDKMSIMQHSSIYTVPKPFLKSDLNGLFPVIFQYNKCSKFSLIHCLPQKIWVIRCWIFCNVFRKPRPFGLGLHFCQLNAFCLVPGVDISRILLHFFSYLQACIKMHRYFLSVHNLMIISCKLIS